MAAGFIGIVVPQLKIYPTEIDIWGLKFHSPDLPFIVAGSLCAVIGYFLIKFFSSYLFEKSSSASALLAAQIIEGRTSLDIVRAEQELDQAGKSLLANQKTFQRQQENAEKRIKLLQEELDLEDSTHVAYLQQLDGQIGGVTKNHDSTSDYSVCILVDETLDNLKQTRETYLRDREKRRQEEIEKLESENNNWKYLSEASVRDLKNEEKDFQEKCRNIIEWKKTHKVVGRISPFHLTLEIWFPLVLGIFAVGSLVYLMCHFPPPPKPLSLPGF